MGIIEMDERVFTSSARYRAMYLVGALIMAVMGMAIIVISVMNPEEISIITAALFGVILIAIAVFLVMTFIRLGQFSAKVGAKELTIINSQKETSYSFERYRFAAQTMHRRNNVTYILIITDNGGNEVKQKTTLKKKDFDNLIQLIEERKMYRRA